MARYRGDYQSISRVWRNQNLSTTFADTLLNIRALATQEQDEILPNTFTDYVENGGGCSFSINRARVARLYLNDNAYLIVPLPWLDSDARFNTFFLEARQDVRITKVEYIGTLIREQSLRWHVQQG